MIQRSGHFEEYGEHKEDLAYLEVQDSDEDEFQI